MNVTTAATNGGNCSADEICCTECVAEPIEVGSAQWFLAASMALLCVIGAALAAGLTMGLTAQDLTSLRIKKSIDPEHYNGPYGYTNTAIWKLLFCVHPLRFTAAVSPFNFFLIQTCSDYFCQTTLRRKHKLPKRKCGRARWSH